MLAKASRPKAGQIGLAFPWQKHMSAKSVSAQNTGFFKALKK
jgi:hypothetical protein